MQLLVLYQNYMQLLLLYQNYMQLLVLYQNSMQLLVLYQKTEYTIWQSTQESVSGKYLLIVKTYTFLKTISYTSKHSL